MDEVLNPGDLVCRDDGVDGYVNTGFGIIIAAGELFNKRTNRHMFDVTLQGCLVLYPHKLVDCNVAVNNVKVLQDAKKEDE